MTAEPEVAANPDANVIDLDSSLALAFGTPIASFAWPDSDGLNQDLQRLVLQKEQQSEGITHSNVGSWHSETDLFGTDEPCVRVLAQRIQQMTGAMTRAVMVNPDPTIKTIDYLMDGWANVTRHGGYNTVHNHPNCLWSGTYYVAAGEAGEGPVTNGRLELLDPRAGINMINIKGTIMEGRYLIETVPGLMVMFPSWLSHFVHPFFGDGERISIAFNILARPQPQPPDFGA
jgi:uncharacterized protein (TIGR02466 family)